MTDLRDPRAEPPPAPPQEASLPTAAITVNAHAAGISAEVHEREKCRSESPTRPLLSETHSSVRRRISRKHPNVDRRRRLAVGSASASIPVSPTSVPEGASEAPELPDTRSELRDWIKDNATLLSNASLLISLATIALSLLPDVGFFAPYIKALIFAAALLLLIELHHQWPEDLQLHMLRKNARPENHSWRMTGFAFIMQVATLIFAIWALLSNPIILLPLTALVVVLAFRQWYFRRYSGLAARSFGIIALIAVLLLTEMLMLVVATAVTGEQVTLELWTRDRPNFQIDP